MSATERYYIHEIENLDIDYNPLILMEKIPPTNCCVLEGGGVKGIGLLGALSAMPEIRSQFEYYAGSSIGGLLAAMLAMGLSPDDVKDRVFNLNFKEMASDDEDLLWDPLSLVSGVKKIDRLLSMPGHGVSTGDKALKFFEDTVAELLGDPNATFADLEKLRKNNPALKDLKLTGTNISRKKLQIFDAEHTPNIRIADAMRITMSYPGAFSAYPLVINGRTEYFVDGGVSSNFPAHVFNHKKYLPKGYSLNENGANPGVMGYLIDSNKEMRNVLWNQYLDEDLNNTESATSFIKALISAMRIDLNVEPYAMQIVQVYDEDIGTLEFEISKERKDRLFESGIKAGQEKMALYHSGAIMGQKSFTSLRKKYKKLSQGDAEHIMLYLEEAYQRVASNQDYPEDVIQARLRVIAQEMLAINKVFGIPILSEALFDGADLQKSIKSEPMPDIELVDLEILLESLPDQELTSLIERYDQEKLHELSEYFVDKIENNLSVLEDLHQKYNESKKLMLQEAEHEKNSIHCLLRLQTLGALINRQVVNDEVDEEKIEQLRQQFTIILARKDIDKRVQKNFQVIVDNIVKIATAQDDREQKTKNIDLILKQLEKDIEQRHTQKDDLIERAAKLDHEIYEVSNQIETNRRALNLYKYAPSTLATLRELSSLNHQLTNFIDKKVGVLTKIMTWFCDRFSISDKYVPTNVLCLRNARELTLSVQDLHAQVNRGISYDKLKDDKDELDSRVNDTISRLASKKAGFWSNTRDSLVRGLKKRQSQKSDSLINESPTKKRRN